MTDAEKKKNFSKNIQTPIQADLCSKMTSKVFFKINPDNEYRLADIEYRVFYDSPEWTKYLTSYKDRGFGIWFADGTIQPYKKNQTAIKDVNKFKVYVTDDDYFVANLPSLDITNTSSLYYEKNSYLTRFALSRVRDNVRLRNKYETL